MDFDWKFYLSGRAVRIYSIGRRSFDLLYYDDGEIWQGLQYCSIPIPTVCAYRRIPQQLSDTKGFVVVLEDRTGKIDAVRLYDILEYVSAKRK
jgi:hypothetical protein